MKLWASERIFVLTAALIATVLLVTYGGRETSVRPVVASPVSVVGATFEPEAMAMMATDRQETWGKPPASSRGRGWVYEVFTPPEIFYDAETRRFRVAGKNSVEALSRSSDSTDFGIELVAIEAAEFPLQLVGYVGEPGTYQGIFVNVETTETFLGTAGRRVPELGLILETFGVMRKAVAIAESMTVTELVAEARVRHEVSGETTLLTDRTRATSGVRRVRLRAVAGDNADWVAEVGDVRRIEAGLYRIEKIQLAPPGVTISKESAGVIANERRTLTPPVSVFSPIQ